MAAAYFVPRTTSKKDKTQAKTTTPLPKSEDSITSHGVVRYATSDATSGQRVFLIPDEHVDRALWQYRRGFIGEEEMARAERVQLNAMKIVNSLIRTQGIRVIGVESATGAIVVRQHRRRKIMLNLQRLQMGGHSLSTMKQEELFRLAPQLADYQGLFLDGFKRKRLDAKLLDLRGMLAMSHETIVSVEGIEGNLALEATSQIAGTQKNHDDLFTKDSEYGEWLKLQMKMEELSREALSKNDRPVFRQLFGSARTIEDKTKYMAFLKQRSTESQWRMFAAMHEKVDAIVARIGHETFRKRIAALTKGMNEANRVEMRNEYAAKRFHEIMVARGLSKGIVIFGARHIFDKKGAIFANSFIRLFEQRGYSVTVIAPKGHDG